MSMTEKLTEIKKLTTDLLKEYPSETNSFMNFMQKAESGPVLDMRIKELINVALAVAAQCEWCIALHVSQALHAGATRDEIMSAGFMAVVMHGGPALMYLIPLREALNELAPGK
ncbi:carboxymuconolactone decarboxylase family protein [Acidithiobacillus sp.]|uniref:carboxymuconolactone decarboxylase family protein n=1 Tax=Acidithiobacillus sp. TaxID=1872118 RepID=UPI0025C58B56|nr:carboxymuconolactone decarboxylase family protein [Acidithiobacillus sp.]